MQIRSANQEEWERFLLECPTATFFHSFEWYSIWAKYTNQHFEAKVFETNGEIKALLPMLIGKAYKGAMKTYTSSPGGTYGGYLLANEISKTEKQILAKLLGKLKYLSVYQNPLEKRLDEKLEWTKETFTQILDLKAGWKAIFSKWSKGHASAAKKGLRQGIEVKQAETTDWKKYFELYQETLSRWGEKALDKYEWRFFQELSVLNKEKCKLWLAWYKSRPIAGCICFYQNNHVVYWHGASTSANYQLRPAQVLQYTIIKDAITKGYEWYDFNPSAGLEGVVQFKKGFGTQVLPIKVLEKRPFFLEVISKFTRNLIQS